MQDGTLVHQDYYPLCGNDSRLNFRLSPGEKE
jgi:hypothetical protein